MSSAVIAPPRHLWLKAVVFALLAWNTGVYVFTGTLSEALDATAWLALLVLFELETDFGDRLRDGRTEAVVRGVRLAAAAAVAAAALGYVRDREWLDAINSGLWVAMVAVLELQVRYPQTAARRGTWFAAALTLVYTGLGALVLAWAWQREWFDAYDAVLWLAALAIIEMNVLQQAAAANV